MNNHLDIHPSAFVQIKTDRILYSIHINSLKEFKDIVGYALTFDGDTFYPIHREDAIVRKYIINHSNLF